MTRQFDVVANPDAEDAARRPYLVVLQSDLVSGLHSTVVAPLVPREHFSGAHRLNPIVSVDRREFWLATHELFAVDRRVLRAKIASLSDHRDAIIAALDFVRTTPDTQHGLWRGGLILSLR
jgi:toxin CcdB